MLGPLSIRRVNQEAPHPDGRKPCSRRKQKPQSRLHPGSWAGLQLQPLPPLWGALSLIKLCFTSSCSPRTWAPRRRGPPLSGNRRTPATGVRDRPKPRGPHPETLHHTCGAPPSRRRALHGNQGTVSLRVTVHPTRPGIARCWGEGPGAAKVVPRGTVQRVTGDSETPARVLPLRSPLHRLPGGDTSPLGPTTAPHPVPEPGLQPPPLLGVRVGLEVPVPPQAGPHPQPQARGPPRSPR